MENDDFMPHHHNHNHNHYNNARQQRQPQQPRYRRPLGSTREASNTSYFSSQNFSIVTAIFVIYIFQRVGFGRGRNNHNNQGGGIMSHAMDWILEVQDYVIAYGQMALDLCRKLRCYMLAGGDDWFLHDMPASPNASASLHPRGRRRNIMATPVGVGSRMIGAGRMPELEETDVNKQEQPQQPQGGALEPEQQQQAVMALMLDKENTDPLEPAFLKDEDYPPGWLVFDPVLGVVSKTEADNYRRAQKQKQEELKLPRQLKPQPIAQRPQQQQTNSPTSVRDANAKQGMSQKSPSQQQQQQQYSPNKNSNNKTQTRPLRTNNVMPSAMHTPHTIAANG